MTINKPSREYLECLNQWVLREKQWAGSVSKLARLIDVSRPAIYDWSDLKIEQFIDETSKQKIFAYCEKHERQPPFCLVETGSDSELEALMARETDLSKIARTIALGISKLGAIQPQLEAPTYFPSDLLKNMAKPSQLKILLLLEMERQNMLGNQADFAAYLAIKPAALDAILKERRTPTGEELLAISSKVADPDGQYHNFYFFESIASMQEPAPDPQQNGSQGQRNKRSNGATV